MQRYDGDGIEQATVDAGLLILRVVTGLVFFMHGYQKLVDFGISNTQAAFNGMGAPLPDLTAVIVTFVEVIGGAALVMGALTRVFAILLVIDMAAAFFIVHAGNGFFVTEGRIRAGHDPRRGGAVARVDRSRCVLGGRGSPDPGPRTDHF